MVGEPLTDAGVPSESSLGRQVAACAQVLNNPAVRSKLPLVACHASSLSVQALASPTTSQVGVPI
jgi:hypothetical protein